MRLDAHQRSLQHAHDQREDQHQVHPRHGQQVREPAGAKGAIVVRGQIALAEDQRARHGPHVGREGRVDAVPHIRARMRSIHASRPRARRTTATSSVPPERTTPRCASDGRGSPSAAFQSRCGAPSVATTSASSPRARSSGPP